MLHSISKIVSSLAVVVVGLGSGYFGTAAYYEKNPQSVAQSGEVASHENTIAWELKNELLAITPWENWRAWSNREKAVKQVLPSESPQSTEFQSLKNSLASGSVKKTCGAVYTKPKEDTNKDKLKADAKKYCGLRFSATATASST